MPESQPQRPQSTVGVASPSGCTADEQGLFLRGNRGLEMGGATPRFLHVHCNGTPAQAVEFLAWAGLASIPSCCPKGHKWKLTPELHWRCNHRVGNDYPFNRCGCYRKTGAYIGQTQIYPQISSNKATRLRPGSILHESVTRYPICGVPRPLGAQIREFGVCQSVHH